MKAKPPSWGLGMQRLTLLMHAVRLFRTETKKVMPAVCHPHQDVWRGWRDQTTSCCSTLVLLEYTALLFTVCVCVCVVCVCVCVLNSQGWSPVSVLPLQEVIRTTNMQYFRNLTGLGIRKVWKRALYIWWQNWNRLEPKPEGGGGGGGRWGVVVGGRHRRGRRGLRWVRRLKEIQDCRHLHQWCCRRGGRSQAACRWKEGEGQGGRVLGWVQCLVVIWRDDKKDKADVCQRAAWRCVCVCVKSEKVFKCPKFLRRYLLLSLNLLQLDIKYQRRVWTYDCALWGGSFN